MKLAAGFFVAFVVMVVVGCGSGQSRGDRRDGGPAPRDAGSDRGVQAAANAPAGSVVFSGGYETDRQDHGRPVALIAGALGVEPEVFRQAFSKVTPARGGGPSAEHARANKRVLMDALGKYGITNERLDEVSNYYRYQPQSGELWTHTPATAAATIRDGKVVSLEITDPGAGYMTPPAVVVAGHADVKVKATIEFTKDLRTNGRLASLTVVE